MLHTHTRLKLYFALQTNEIVTRKCFYSFQFHPHLGRKMESAMKRLVNDSIKFELALSEDGSGRGAALAAAVAVKLDERKRKTQN